MYDVIIVGAGPAGLSASVYAKRAGLNAITLEAQPISGGQVNSTYEVDNYLGFKGISGLDLCTEFRNHADALGCEFKIATVKLVEKCEEYFRVSTNEGDFETRTVVFAMGANHAKLGIPGEEELAGMGVSYCATCDGAFFKDRVVAVIGGGDVAVEDAIFLARKCKKVYVVHRRNELRAAKLLQDKLFALPNVSMIWDSTALSIEGEDQVERLVVENVNTKEVNKIDVDGVFIAVGILPENEVVKGIVKVDEKGYVITDEMCTSSEPGIFAAGDLRSKKLRQIVTAVADGANAITSVEEYLLKR